MEEVEEVEEVECIGVASCLGLIKRHVACSQFSASVLLKDVGVPFITKAESHSDDSLEFGPLVHRVNIYTCTTHD